MAIKSFVMALRDVVAIKGETLADFRNQYKDLSDNDKLDLHIMLSEAGIDCHPPVRLPA